jgi:peptide deformylase
MTKEAIISIPNILLKQPSRKIGHIDKSIQQLVSDMISATLDWEDSRNHEIAAALAAVQIGQPYRLVIVRKDFNDRKDRSFAVFINPEIVKTLGEPVEDLEGCLSVPDIYGSVPRYPKVKVKALDLEGRPVRLTAEGFLARVFQHEIDHTNGLLFTDRITDVTQLKRLNPDGRFSTMESHEKP